MIISDGLSVVIPCYNEGNHLEKTINKILESHSKVDFPLEIIVSDDGSTDDCIKETQSKINSEKLKFLLNQHAGRVETIFKGISNAQYPNVMVLGSRVQIREGMLGALQQLSRSHPDAKFWNGLIHIQDYGNPLVSIWQTLVMAGWGGYLRNPTTTHFGIKDFDKYPKGSGFFITSKTNWLSGFEKLRNYSVSLRAAVSDDTRLIRDFAEIDDIWISNDIEADYQPRTNWKAFLRNGYYRGTTFVDSYWESRTFIGKSVRISPPLVLCLIFIGSFVFEPQFLLGAPVLTVLFSYFVFSVKEKKKPFLAIKEVIVLPPLLTVFTAGFLQSYFQGLRMRTIVLKSSKSK